MERVEGDDDDVKPTKTAAVAEVVVAPPTSLLSRGAPNNLQRWAT
jgi:hypothetical protein